MVSTQIALLKKYGLAVRGTRGQHLLIDPNIQRKIMELLDPLPKEWILEIGPGLGALTAEILAAGACVMALEKDRRFCEILEGELGRDYPGKLWVENADVLRTHLGKLLLRARQFFRIREKGKRPRKLKVVSNLPYYITTPVLFWLIANRAYIEKAILMMQREVADRLLAQPGDKDYGRLTLAIRYYAAVERAFEVSRNSFTPKPRVDSSVITIDFHPASRLPKGVDENFLFHVIQVGFGQRRKTFLSRLAHNSQINRPRNELAQIFRALGISEKARGEDLLLKDFISLAESLSRQKKDEEPSALSR